MSSGVTAKRGAFAVLILSRKGTPSQNLQACRKWRTFSKHDFYWK